MSDLTRIEQNNAELRECIEIAESLPDAPQSVGGYDIATMQKFIDSRRDCGQLTYLYAYYTSSQTMTRLTDADLEWLSKVDTGNAQYTRHMFDGCESWDWTTIPLFDMSNITDMMYMFRGAQATSNRGTFIAIPPFNTSKVTRMDSAFQYRKLRNFPLLRYDSAQVTSSMFADATFITTSDRAVPTLDLPEVTNAYSMFNRTNLVSVKDIYAPKATDMTYMFHRCQSLVSVGDISSEASVSITSMFYGCTSLQKVGALPNDIKNCQDAFNDCGALLVVPPMNTHTCGSTMRMFAHCRVLETIPYVDMRNATSTTSMFINCVALANLTVKNIKANLQVGSGTYYGHLLTVDSLVGLCYELRDTGSVKTLTIGSANLEKLASVYVRQIAITDAMRAEDDLIGEKLPFERCESTDEGATLIADYVLLKNWKLA